jgi:hypothetical protein
LQHYPGNVLAAILDVFPDATGLVRCHHGISDLVPSETAFQSKNADKHGSFPRFVFRSLPVPGHELNSILMGSANDVTNALLKSKILQAMTPIHANSMMGHPDPPSLFCMREISAKHPAIFDVRRLPHRNPLEIVFQNPFFNVTHIN